MEAIYHRYRAPEKQQAMEKFDVFPTTGRVPGAAIRDNEGTAHPYGDVLAGPSRLV